MNDIPDVHGDCMRNQKHLAQLILTVARGVEVAYVDNIYFYK